MKKWKKLAALIAGCLLLATGCAPAAGPGESETPSEPPPTGDPVPEYREVITDNVFATGFNVMGQYPDVDGRTIYRKLDYKGTAKPTDSPLWYMAQWNYEHYSLVDAEETEANGTYSYIDGSKKVRVDPATGKLQLELNTEFEYDAPREQGGRWPHILIEQNFATRTKIRNAKKIEAELTFSIDKVENKMGNAYNANLHSAQFLWYFTLQNMPESGTEAEVGKKGDYLWFGVPLYDYRYGTIAESAIIDGGGPGTTGKLIYSMSNGWYLPTPIDVGETYELKVDIYPYLRGAYDKAQEMGLLKNVKFENLEFNYMNLGWEVPGTFNVASTISHLSCKVYD